MPRLLPLVAVALLLATATPALADRQVAHERDEDAFLVGAPGVDEEEVQQRTGGLAPLGVAVSTQKAYPIDVRPEKNLLRVHLRYDAGNAVPGRSCLRINDLDLEIVGPNGVPIARYPGCDPGEITFRRFNVPTGPYSIEVTAEQGTTACLPQPDDPCTAGGIDYLIDIKVFAIE